MKKTGLISLICSLIAVAVVSIAVILVLFFSGVISFEKTKLVISSPSAMKTYDGEELNDRSWSILEGELRKGHTIEVTVSGSQTGVGISENYLKAIIRDKGGADVTDEYNIVYKPGALNVKARLITLIADSDMKRYDGIPLVRDGYSIASSASLLENHTIEANVEGSILDIGRTDNLITKVVIFNAKGEDVTRNYNVKTVKGTLIVYSADSIVIESESDSKEYDGEPLTNGGWNLVSGKLVEGDEIFVDVFGSITEVGTADNEFNVVIKDAYGNDVTTRYDVVKSYGKLTVTEPDPRTELKFETSGAGKFYDGKPLSNGNWSLVSGELELGHVPEVTVTGSITDVGTSKNTAEIVIRNESGKDVSHLYDIETELGILEVKPMTVVITSDTAQKTYDGAPLTDAGFSVEPSYLLEDFEFLVDVTGSRTEVGESENSIDSYTVKNSDGADVTDNFDVTVKPGTLTVLEQEEEVKPVLSYGTESASKTYDGTPLTSTEGGRISGELLEGHREVIEMNATITDAGKVQNSIEVTILDENGQDVTDSYEIEFNDENIGTLTVLPKEITITAADAEKEYDGEPLVSEEYTIEPEDALIDGHIAKVELSGSRLNVGTSKNEVSSYEILDAEGNDVSDNYDVTLNSGELTVTRPADTNLGAPMDPGAEITFFIVKNSKDDNIYLKMTSYADFNSSKNGWLAAPVYDKLLSSGESAFFLTSYALKNSGLSSASAEILPKMNVFALPYYSVGDIIKPSTDTTVIGDASDIYTVEYYDWDSVAGISVPSAYAAAELEYREYVKNTYLQIDDETLAFMNRIISEEGFDANAGDVIDKVASYIRRSARYNLEYDRNLDSADNVPIAFLSVYKEGICQHYATAATLLFRALGIPARYTVGFAAPVTKGIETEVTSRMAHAWVEVYVNGIGWINVEVTGSGNAATGTNKPKDLVIAPAYTGEIFASQTLLALQDVTGMEELEKEGYTYEAAVAGSNSELGITKSEVTGLKIYDSFGVLVYDKEAGIGADKFKIHYKTGDVHLYLSELTFRSPSYSKVYDGIELTFDKSECILANGALYEGYSYDITSISSAINASQIASGFTVKIYKDSKLCNDHYKINYDYGILSISKRNLDLTAGSAEKAYDGTELVCDTIIYDRNQLADGDEITDKTISGTQTNIGKSSNVIRSVTIRNAKGEDVTENYLIVMNDGLLKVTRPQR